MTPPGWPKGYPFVATEDFDNPNRIATCITLKKGEEGTVFEIEPSKGQWARVGVGRRDEVGLVPTRCIEIGTVRKVGDVEVYSDLPTHITPSNNPTVFQVQNTVLHKTISLLLATIYERADLLRLPVQFRAELDTKMKRDHIITQIVIGLNETGMFDILCSSAFSIWDLINQGNLINSNIRMGIYLIAYWNFRNDSSRAPGTYTGKTVDFYNREHDHQYEGEREKLQSIHYKTRRAAKNNKMFPICVLARNSERLRTIVEQIFILLLGGYHSAVLSNDVVVQGTSADDPGESVVPQTSRWVEFRRAATLLHRLATEVFSKTGWIGGCGRDSFIAATGTNCDSPMLAEHHQGEKAIWTQQIVPGQIAFYRRAPRKVNEKHGGSRIVLHISGEKRNFEVYIGPNERGPPVGAKATVVVEIMLNGQPHAIPYARLPRCGPWMNWSEGNAIGIRVEWKEGDKWQWVYCQVFQAFNFEKNVQEPGALSSFVGIMSLKRYLTQVPAQNMFPWTLDWGFARVCSIVYNHLQQTIFVGDRPQPIGQSSTHAILRPLADIKKQLEDAHVGRVGGEYGAVPSVGPRKQGGQRKSCDLCYILQVRCYLPS